MMLDAGSGISHLKPISVELHVLGPIRHVERAEDVQGGRVLEVGVGGISTPTRATNQQSTVDAGAGKT